MDIVESVDSVATGTDTMKPMSKLGVVATVVVVGYVVTCVYETTGRLALRLFNHFQKKEED